MAAAISTRLPFTTSVPPVAVRVGTAVPIVLVVTGELEAKLGEATDVLIGAEDTRVVAVTPVTGEVLTAVAEVMAP